MTNTTSLLSRAAVIFGLAFGAFALSALASNVPWQGAPGSPTNCPDTIAGCSPAINVGPNATMQEKLDSLGIDGSLGVALDMWIGGNLRVNGQLSRNDGKVLSDDGSGHAIWVNPTP